MNLKEPINYSISGELSQQLTVFQKSGIALFVLGLAGIFWTYESDFKYLGALISFSAMFIGSILFTTTSLKSLLDGQKLYFHSPLHTTALALGLLGLSILLFAWSGTLFFSPGISLLLSFGGLTLGILLFTYAQYSKHPSGIKNNFVWFNALSGRGIIGWSVGIFLTLFYIQLYWAEKPFQELITMLDSISQLFRNRPSDKYFVYGSLYTFIILLLGVKFIFKYRHNRYQIIRTIVVIFSQLVLAYFIPNVMEGLNYNSAEIVQNGEIIRPGYYNANPINSWPLHAEYSSFDVNTLKVYTADAYQPVGMAYFVWGIIMFLLITPLVTYFVGKRWYCSWFCGCGGLAETAGDSFRHLSNKSVKAWNIERWLIHSIMVFVLIMTLAVMCTYFFKSDFSFGFVSLNKNLFMLFATLVLGVLLAFLIISHKKQTIKNKALQASIVVLVLIISLLIIAYFSGNENAFFIESKTLKKTYGFFVGSVFSGVIGVGFYPILGNRVWCRFGCPMAGYMGLVQRFRSKFRITTNGGQCISCGNCSTYCEQGIDVRAYAQRGENIVRASCVGCGVCSAVCPRGVLKLENGPLENREQNNLDLLEMMNRK